MIKNLLICIVATTGLFLNACDDGKKVYVETNRGIISAKVFNCNLGMLVNRDKNNIYDENNKPMTCKGYIRLTPEEFDKWGE